MSFYIILESLDKIISYTLNKDNVSCGLSQTRQTWALRIWNTYFEVANDLALVSTYFPFPLG